MRGSSSRMTMSYALVKNALKHRAPGARHQAVAGAVLLDLTQTREREMEPDDLRLFGRGHVVEFVTCSRRQIRLDVIHHVPIGMAQEQCRDVGHIGLDEDAPRARLQRERSMSGRVAGG